MMTKVEYSKQFQAQHLGPQATVAIQEKGSLDNLSERGEEEELGEPIGLATMILSQITKRETDFKGFKMYLKVYS